NQRVVMVFRLVSNLSRITLRTQCHNTPVWPKRLLLLPSSNWIIKRQNGGTRRPKPPGARMRVFVSVNGLLKRFDYRQHHQVFPVTEAWQVQRAVNILVKELNA